MTPFVDAEGLTSEWLSYALARGVTLRASRRIGTGQTSASYRLEVDGAGLPSSLVAKVGAGTDDARTRVRGGVRAEVGIYQHVLATVDARAPHCWYAAASDDALRFTLLLEDLAPRLPGVQVDGCSVGQAEGAVRNLAGLHAPRWNDSSLLGLDFLRRSDADGAAFLSGLMQRSAPVFIEWYRDVLSAEDVRTLQAAADAIGVWITARTEPFALLHGDYRLDNLMFDPEGRDVMAVDWQTVMIGPPTRDLAYFVGTSLEPADRRAAEHQLVATYHDALVARGVQGYSPERCFDDYRLGHLQGPLITMIGAAVATAERSAEADEMFLAMARRSCAAIRDLDSLSLL